MKSNLIGISKEIIDATPKGEPLKAVTVTAPPNCTPPPPLDAPSPQEPLLTTVGAKPAVPTAQPCR